MAKSESVKIIESYISDVGKGILRINNTVSINLSLLTDDVVSINGTRKTVAVVKRLNQTERNRLFCRTDGLVRNNAGINSGDSAVIQKIDHHDAETISVVPIESWPLVDERYLADALEKVALIKGDNGMIPYFGSRLTFQVVETQPLGAVVTTLKTKFTIIEPTELQKIKSKKEKNEIKELQEYVGRRVFSTLQDIKEAESETETKNKKQMIKSIWNNSKELLEQIKSAYPNNDFVPKSVKAFDELEDTSGVAGSIQYLKSHIRKIADGVGIKHLEILVEKKELGTDVFIVHGHDETAKEKVARLIEKIELKAVILHEQPNAGKTIIEKFEKYSANIGFAVIILTPDDVIRMKNKKGTDIEEKRARQNVILELGFFTGAIGRERTCVLYKKGVDLPSDYDGVVYVPMDDSDGWKLALAKEIKQSGIPVDMNKIV